MYAYGTLVRHDVCSYETGAEMGHIDNPFLKLIPCAVSSGTSNLKVRGNTRNY